MKILLAGASGFIGSALRSELAKSHNVTTLVRRNPTSNNEVFWNPSEQALSADVSDYEAVINLGGHPIGKRLTSKEKHRVLQSRLQTTTLLRDAINTAKTTPKVFLNASAIGFYGTRGEEHLTEQSSNGDTYLANLVKQWEAAATGSNCRTVLLRTGIVLGIRGGILKRVLPLFRFGLGGNLGSGKQWMSWISITDEVGGIIHALQNDSVVGPINLTSPQPVRNHTFTKSLGHQLHRPTFVPAPSLGIRAIFGKDLSEEFLGSKYVLPSALQKHGYTFRHPSLNDAWKELIVNGKG